MTVVVRKKTSKPATPTITKKEAKEVAKLRELNPHNTRSQKKVSTH